jgi:hypothetical protein
MSSWTAFLLTYMLGGLTFAPLVILTVLVHAHFTFPVRKDDTTSPEETIKKDIVQTGDDIADLKAAQKDETKTWAANADTDVAAGYFGVSREYTPMGINAKPIERSTPVGSTTVTAPSPSVYQTMYRSLFDRKQASNPLDGQSNSQRPKKAGNVFYVVLRHGHLMLFDDDEQLEVRHVISLAHHNVGIYSGGDTTPEGELFIKRNAICLSRRSDSPVVGADTRLSKPFYLFSENTSAKEDFYFALLRSQQQSAVADGTVPAPLNFDIKHIISLVQKLHSSEEHQQTRWLNAMVGRVFLGLYKTKDMENLIREKLTKKISRVNRPSFLSNITIQGIDTGEAAPYFTNLRLKDLTVEGECGMEADVRYTGKCRLEVAATARIELGSRLKAREVSLVLAVVINKLEGHMLFKIKPPPSNRIWFSFQSMPKIDMTIEPIVSSRQITYNVILRQIENRIKEVIAETLVLPFWDDVPFFRTEHKKWRGGIFDGDDEVVSSSDPGTALAQAGDVDDVDELEQNGTQEASTGLTSREKSHSLPVIEALPKHNGFFGRKKGEQKSNGSLASSASTSTASVDTKPESLPERRNVRRSSFMGSAAPTTGTDVTNVEAIKAASSPPSQSISVLQDLSASPPATDAASKSAGGSYRPYITSRSSKSSQSSLSSREVTDSEKDVDNDDEKAREKTPQARRGPASSAESHDDSSSQSPTVSMKGSIRSQTGLLARNLLGRSKDNPSADTSGQPSLPPVTEREQQRKNAIAAVTNVAASAKRWGLNALQRNNDGQTHRGSQEHDPPVDLKQPMGRGRPLPPPGTPLPMPERKTKTAPAPLVKRKPILPPRLDHYHGHIAHHEQGHSVHPPPPPLPQRRSQLVTEPGHETEDGGMLVVAAPAESEPTTPLTATQPDEQQSHYFQSSMQDANDARDTGVNDEHDTNSEPARRSGLDLVSPTRVMSHTRDSVSLLESSGSDHQAESASEEEAKDDDYSAWMDNVDASQSGPPSIVSEVEAARP